MEQEISMEDGFSSSASYYYRQPSSNNRLSFSTSTSIEDLTNSPIDLICQRIVNNISSSESDDDNDDDDDDPSPLGWPLARKQRSQLKLSPVTPPEMPSSPKSKSAESTDNVSAAEISAKKHSTEVEMMKERFSRLLLGEDMSGSGKGVCTALAISNAITNLAASAFCELWKLEPLSPERKAMWKREMDWLLSVCDHIVEFVPSFHNVADGSSLEVMISRPRSDLQINLPALRKLDAMLLEALDSFKETEFWYVDQGMTARDGPERDRRENIKRQEEKWWLPVPKIPTGGLSEGARKALQQQRDSTSQILKAAMAINEQVLSEMQVPEVYYDSLPKSAKSSLGERIYHGLRVEHFFPDALLSALDVYTEHNALEVANRIQAAVNIWRKKKTICHPKTNTTFQSDAKVSTGSRYPWSKVKDMVAECDSDKKLMLIERAESLLLCLRQRFPGLPQTVLDVNKIQFNKDLGQAILESYSRVLESLAFSILSRIDDVLYIADMTKRNIHVQGSRQLGTSFPTRVTMSTPFVTPYASPGSGSSSPSSPQQRQTNSPVASTLPVASPVDTTTATSASRLPVAGTHEETSNSSVCPSFLGSLCNLEAGTAGVKEAKKPVARPWLDMEQHKKSFYSPPGRD